MIANAYISVIHLSVIDLNGFAGNGPAFLKS
jgi:hypothetical protein